MLCNFTHQVLIYFKTALFKTSKQHLSFYQYFSSSKDYFRQQKIPQIQRNHSKINSYTSKYQQTYPLSCKSLHCSLLNSQLSKRLFSTVKLSHLTNPFTLEPVSDKKYFTKQQIQTTIKQLQKTQEEWKTINVDQRLRLIDLLLDQIIKDKQLIKQKNAQEIGKSFKDTQNEFNQLQCLRQTLMTQVMKIYQKENTKQNSSSLSPTIFIEPIGLVLLFPYFSQPILDSLLHVIPCLLTGNGCLIKSTDYNHFLGGYLQRKADQILGYKIVRDLFIQPSELPQIGNYKSVKKIIFSGSGSSARHIIETLLEKKFIQYKLFIGEENYAYVDQTANLQFTASQIINTAFKNNGQSYHSVKKLFLHNNVKQQLIQKLIQKIASLKMGNPKDPSVDLGPLAMPQTATKIQSFVTDAINEGARCQIGGMITNDQNGKGIFFEPTLIYDPQGDLSQFPIDISGPILCCLGVQSDEDFFNTIKESQLQASIRIFTNSSDPIKRYEKFIRSVESDKIIFNRGTYFNTKSEQEDNNKMGLVSNINIILSATCDGFTTEKIVDLGNSSDNQKKD